MKQVPGTGQVIEAGNDSNLNVLKQAILDVHASGYYHSDRITKKMFKEVESVKVKAPHLIESEQQVLKLICTGHDCNEVAAELKITLSSVKGHRDNIFKKFNVTNKLVLASLFYGCPFPL